MSGVCATGVPSCSPSLFFLPPLFLSAAPYSQPPRATRAPRCRVGAFSSLTFSFTLSIHFLHLFASTFFRLCDPFRCLFFHDVLSPGDAKVSGCVLHPPIHPHFHPIFFHCFFFSIFILVFSLWTLFVLGNGLLHFLRFVRSFSSVSFFCFIPSIPPLHSPSFSSFRAPFLVIFFGLFVFLLLFFSFVLCWASASFVPPTPRQPLSDSPHASVVRFSHFFFSNCVRSPSNSLLPLSAPIPSTMSFSIDAVFFSFHLRCGAKTLRRCRAHRAAARDQHLGPHLFHLLYPSHFSPPPINPGAHPFSSVLLHPSASLATCADWRRIPLSLDIADIDSNSCVCVCAR